MAPRKRLETELNPKHRSTRQPPRPPIHGADLQPTPSLTADEWAERLGEMGIAPHADLFEVLKRTLRLSPGRPVVVDEIGKFALVFEDFSFVNAYDEIAYTVDIPLPRKAIYFSALWLFLPVGHAYLLDFHVKALGKGDFFHISFFKGDQRIRLRTLETTGNLQYMTTAFDCREGPLPCIGVRCFQREAEYLSGDYEAWDFYSVDIVRLSGG